MTNTINSNNITNSPEVVKHLILSYFKPVVDSYELGLRNTEQAIIKTFADLNKMPGQGVNELIRDSYIELAALHTKVIAARAVCKELEASMEILLKTLEVTNKFSINIVVGDIKGAYYWQQALFSLITPHGTTAADRIAFLNSTINLLFKAINDEESQLNKSKIQP